MRSNSCRVLIEKQKKTLKENNLQKQLSNQKRKESKMLLGASNHCSAAAASKNAATDFSIAAIMSRNAQSREPSERSLSKYPLIQ